MRRATPFVALALTLGLASGISLVAQGHHGGASSGAIHRGQDLDKTPIDDFERMSPEQQQKALAKLPPERRKKVQEQLARLRNLPPEQRAALRQTYQRLSEFPPDRQQQLRKSLQKFGSQPSQRQQAMREELRHLSEQSPEERANRLNSPEFRHAFNRSEQQVVRDMSDLFPSR
jgi:hypothetical protein